jgi:hypothetical protein
MGRKAKPTTNTKGTDASCLAAISSKKNSNFRQLCITDFLVKKKLVSLPVTPEESSFTTPVPIVPSTGMPLYQSKGGHTRAPSSTTVGSQNVGDQNYTTMFLAKVSQALSSLAYSGNSSSDLKDFDIDSISSPSSVPSLTSSPF